MQRRGLRRTDKSKLKTQKEGQEGEVARTKKTKQTDTFMDKKGRIKNISTAISIVRFLANKDYICVISIVAPYRFLRDELKEDFNFLEVFLHTTEIRGRENFFAKDYEEPVDPNHLRIDTGKLTIKESLDEILDVYRKMATVA